ncbi:MAG: BatD family protein [Bacteroidota bacterium]
MIRIWTIYLLLILGMGSMFSQSFTAFVDKNQVGQNETFKASFRLEGGQSNDIRYPSFDGFQVLSGPSTSTSMQIINGQVNQSTTFSFYLRPTRKGKLTIGSASVKFNGKTYKSDAVSVSVGEAKAAPSNQQQNQQQSKQARNQSIEKQLKDAIYLRAIPSTNSLYVGDQLTVTYKLYRRVEVSNLTSDEPPNYGGFWVESVDIPKVTTQLEVVNGVQFRTAVIKKDILFPQRDGTLTIDPMTLSCDVQVQSQQRKRRQSIFDSFFAPVETYQYKFANPPIKITAKALPTSSKPADFNGMIGKWNMDVQVDKTETETGEPVTFRVRISGQGNIKKLPEPKLDFPPDFEVYDPNISEQTSRSKGKLGGRRTYEYLLVPRNPGAYKLPTASFSYFDVGKKSYQQLSSPEYKLTVTGEPQQGNASISPNFNKEDVELIGQAIRHISLGDPGLKQARTSLAGSGKFWIALLLPFMLFGGLFFWKRQTDQAAADVVGTRSKKATKMAKKRLSIAQKHMGEGNEKAFYDEVVRAVWGYLGDKLRLGQSDLSREEVRKVLEQKSVASPLIDRLIKLLDTCEMALFAPVAVQGGMKGTYEEAMGFITQVEGQL